MSVYRRVARYLVPYRARFLLALGLVALSALLEIAKPWPLKIVIDHVLGAKPLELPFARELDARSLLAAACIGLLALQVTLAVLGVRLNRLTIGIGQRMVNDLREKLLDHLQRMSLGFFGRRASQDLVYRVAFDTYALQSMAMNGLFPFVTAIVLLAGMTVVMVRMNPLLAGIFLAVAPLLFVTIRTVG
ncbi:MAG TPA: ABC transporter transmembrane domain-containing protein, partial [Myxococcota bacterium]|nr:ABC transporter transmembrane domain-containing protein [Myxococcota bacterium]